MTSPVVDGSASGTVTSGSSGSASLSTTDSPDLIYAVIYCCGFSTTPTVSSVTAAGLTFAQRKVFSGDNGGSSSTPTDTEIWTAPASAPLSSLSITVNISRSLGANDSVAFVFFGANGIATPPFDNNASLPSFVNNVGGSGHVTASTTFPDDLLLFICGTNLGAAGTFAPPTGFSVIQHPISTHGEGANLSVSYKSVSSIQSSANFTIGSSSTAYGEGPWGLDALTANASLIALEARGTAQSKGRAAPLYATPIFARGTAQAKGSALIGVPSSRLALYARGTAQAKGNAVLSGVLALYARGTAQAKGRPVLTAVAESLYVTKLNAYAVLTPYQPNLSVSKLNAYAVLTPYQPNLSASKLIAYVVFNYAYAPVPPVLPALPIGLPVKMTPTMATVTGSIPSGRDMRAYQQDYPIWEFEVSYEVLRDQTQNQVPYPVLAGFTEFMQLSSQFVAAIGPFGQFFFDAWWDDSRTGQPIAAGDGTSANFIMVRTWGYGDLQFTEPVGAVNQNLTVTIYLDGVAQSPDAWFIQVNNILTFVDAPANGVTITADFSYYYLCQFVDQAQDFQENYVDIWETKLKFRSIIQH